MVNGAQYTILWYLDDLQISHIDPEVVTKMIDALNGEYVDTMTLPISRGKVHDYLSMVLDCTTAGEVLLQIY